MCLKIFLLLEYIIYGHFYYMDKYSIDSHLDASDHVIYGKRDCICLQHRVNFFMFQVQI